MIDRRRLLQMGATCALSAALPASARAEAQGPAVVGGPAGGAPPVALPAASGAAPTGVDLAAVREAARTGDVARLAAAVATDAAVLFLRDAQDRTLYQLAAAAGQGAVQRWLTERGYATDVFDAASADDTRRLQELFTADPARVLAAATRFGLSPLHVAAELGRPGAVEFLVGRGGASADAATAPDEAGRPREYLPLRSAVQHPDRAAAEVMAQVMLGNGADANAPSRDGTSLLHAAAHAGHARVVHLLLRKGADPAARDAAGRTPREVAAAAGHTAVAALLARAAGVPRDRYATRFAATRDGRPVARDDTYGIPQTWINQFVTVAHFDLARTRAWLARCPDLLSTRATWDEVGVEGPVHIGNIPIAEFLLERGAPYSICAAAMLGDLTSVRRHLAEDPSRARERGPHDIPALWFPAFGRNQVGAAEALLDAGAEVNADVRGRTALHVAAARGHVEMAELLLARGADATIVARTDLARGTPLQVARQAKQERVVALFAARGIRS